jgi:hypothetical protein
MNPRLRLLPVLIALMCLSGCGGGDYPVDAAAAAQAPSTELTSSVLAAGPVGPAGIAASAATDAASAAAPPAVSRRPEPAQATTPDGDTPGPTPQTEDTGQGVGRAGDRAAREADASEAG